MATQKSEIAKLKERNTKLDKDLNTALDTLKQKEWECTQLEKRQDKTIVEHVHVLQEAKAVTDRVHACSPATAYPGWPRVGVPVSHSAASIGRALGSV